MLKLNASYSKKVPAEGEIPSGFFTLYIDGVCNLTSPDVRLRITMRTALEINAGAGYF